VFLLSKSKRYYYDHLAVHEGNRNLRAVWRIARQSAAGHPAAFPERLVEICLLAGTKTNDVVLDIFAGSGTTGVVAIKHNRQFVGLEINEDYCVLAKNRITEALGVTPSASVMSPC